MDCSSYKPLEPPSIKPPLTIEEQIALLKERGLMIDDEDYAKKFLTHVSYYRLSGYTLSLRKNDIFNKGATFQLVCRLYEFDQKLRYMLLSVIETIEISFRTQIANHLGLKYGPLGYLESSYFKDSSYHQQLMGEFEKQVEKNKEKELFVRHHIEKYNRQFPIWVAIEIFSFGMLSRLFKIMKREDQKAISCKYYNSSPYYIESWLHALVNLRNICAHYGRIYNRTFTITPKLDKEGKELGIKNNKLFAFIFIIKRLQTTRSKWTTFLTNLEALVKEYRKDIELSLLGFPEKWYEILQKQP